MKSTITRLVNDEGAVSPVIGVILMVAITVILAAVIGTFVLGLGGQVSQTAPQASISVQSIDNTNNAITFKHGGSDSLVASDTNIKVTGPASGDGFALTSGSDAKFSTADTFTLVTDQTANGGSTDFVSSPGWAATNWDAESGATTFSFTSGDTVTVTFIDNPSGQIIADKTVNA